MLPFIIIYLFFCFIAIFPPVSCLIYLIIAGGVKSFGVLYTELLDYYDAGAGNTAWISSVCMFLFMGLGKIIFYLFLILRILKCDVKRTYILKQLPNKNVCCQTDNSNSKCLLDKGPKKLVIQAIPKRQNRCTR